MSLPVAKNTNAAAVFAKATKVLSATSFATSFTVAMKKEAAPLFVTGAATPFVNSQGSIFDLDSAYNVTIFKSPGPTSVPTSTPSGLPTGQPSSAPSRAPQLYVVPPLLTPEQIAIVITTAQVLAGAIVVSLLAYVAFFKCYLLDRRWKGGKTKGKHSGQFVLDLPEERVVEIVVEKQAARILNKKDRAKLREQERERADRTRHEHEHDVDHLHSDHGEGGYDAMLNSPKPQTPARPSSASRAPTGWVNSLLSLIGLGRGRGRDAVRVYVSTGSTLGGGEGEEHKDDGGSRDGFGFEGTESESELGSTGTGRRKPKSPGKKGTKKGGGRVKGGRTKVVLDVAPESGDEGEGEVEWGASSVLSPKPLGYGPGKSSLGTGSVYPLVDGRDDEYDEEFALGLYNNDDDDEYGGPSRPLVTRKERLAQKEAARVLAKLSAVQSAMDAGVKVDWEQVSEMKHDDLSKAVAGAEGAASLRRMSEFQGLSQEERRARQRKALEEAEAKKRHQLVIDSVKADFDRRREAALAARFTPLDHSSPLAEATALRLMGRRTSSLAAASATSSFGSMPSTPSAAGPDANAMLVPPSPHFPSATQRPPPLSGPRRHPHSLQEQHTQSLFDTDFESRRQQAIVRRLDNRAAETGARLSLGILDSVIVNSGPPTSVIPRGYRVAPIAPPLTWSALNHRRVMVKWDKEGARGWLPGTVCSVSQRSGFNFAIKYDKTETNCIEADGIKTTSLRLDGECAYGRYWVLLEPEGGGGGGGGGGGDGELTAQEIEELRQAEQDWADAQRLL